MFSSIFCRRSDVENVRVATGARKAVEIHRLRDVATADRGSMKSINGNQAKICVVETLGDMRPLLVSVFRGSP